MGVFSQLAQGVDLTSMGAMGLRIVAVLLCLVVHEVCHGLAAYWLGDPTGPSPTLCWPISPPWFTAACTR